MMCLTIAAAPLVFVGDEVTAVQKEYKNYVFDLYGTLVDIHTDEENGALWDRFSLYLLSKGLSYDPHVLRSTYLQFCREEERKAEAALGSREGPAEIDLMNVFRRLAEHDGAGLTANDLRDTALAFRALSLKKLSVYPHGAEVLQELKRRGDRIILLTNAQACFTIPELKWLGLYDLFDRIFISGEASYASTVFYRMIVKMAATRRRKKASRPGHHAALTVIVISPLKTNSTHPFLRMITRETRRFHACSSQSSRF